MIYKQKILIFLLVILFSYLLILQMWAIWDFTIDDMYITLRYAKNWAESGRLLWNVGANPVEGYSNFSFVLLATAAIKFGFNPVYALKVAGLIGLSLITLIVYFLSRIWFSKYLSLIPCLWLLLYKGQIIWSTSGLETTIYQALIAASLYFLLRATGYHFFPNTRGFIHKHYFVLVGIFFALASLTRPEGPFIMAVFFAVAWVDRCHASKEIVAGLGLSVLIFCLVYLPYFIWRYCYYDRLFPNPVYCKGFSGDFMFEVDKNYLMLAWPFLLLAMIGSWRNTDYRHYYFWLPSLIYLILLIGADPIVAFENRLFLPAFILLLPLSLLGIRKMLSYFKMESNSAVIFFASLMAFFSIPMMSVSAYQNFTHYPKKGESLRLKVVNWLQANIPLGSRVVLADCGLIPYLSPLVFIDSYCLNNREMTHYVEKNRYQRFCTDTINSNPEVIILTSLIEKGRITYTPADSCLHEKLNNNLNYQFRVSFHTDHQQSDYRYEIFTALN